MLPNDAHPNALGEDQGGVDLLAAIQTHLATQAWWYPTTQQQMRILETVASAWTKSNPTSCNSHESSNPDDAKRLDHVYRASLQTFTYIKFDLTTVSRPVTRALLQLSASLEYATQACYVHRVSSVWDESGTNAIKESNAPAEQECVGTLPNGSRSHAIALDVTTVVNQYRGQRLSFRFRAMNTGDSGSDPTNRRAWYSRDDDSANPTPNRGPRLILVETAVTEPFAYLERSVDSALAQRLR